jgi:hypothetical protein
MVPSLVTVVVATPPLTPLYLAAMTLRVPVFVTLPPDRSNTPAPLITAADTVPVRWPPNCPPEMAAAMSLFVTVPPAVRRTPKSFVPVMVPWLVMDAAPSPA